MPASPVPCTRVNTMVLRCFSFGCCSLTRDLIFCSFASSMLQYAPVWHEAGGWGGGGLAEAVARHSSLGGGVAYSAFLSLLPASASSNNNRQKKSFNTTRDAAQTEHHSTTYPAIPALPSSDTRDIASLLWDRDASPP